MAQAVLPRQRIRECRPPASTIAPHDDVIVGLKDTGERGGPIDHGNGGVVSMFKLANGAVRVEIDHRPTHQRAVGIDRAGPVMQERAGRLRSRIGCGAACRISRNLANRQTGFCRDQIGLRLVKRDL